MFCWNGCKTLSNREMRKVIQDQKSEWCSVKNRAPQGSVLAPVMFLVYVNHMTEGVDSFWVFVDDAKLLKKN